jgi:hypothetical protein
MRALAMLIILGGGGCFPVQSVAALKDLNYPMVVLTELECSRPKAAPMPPVISTAIPTRTVVELLGAARADIEDASGALLNNRSHS